MNSYHVAMNQASNNGQFPELFDCWRNYHPEAILSDSDLNDPAFEAIEFLKDQA